jgi:surface polysaccharide O-acyltransferase-like enzyme
VLGAVGFLATILLNVAVAFRTNKPCSKYYDTFTLNVLFEAVAVVVWFKNRKYDNEKLNAVVSKLSKYSFGAYLVHVLVMAVLNEFGFNAFSFNPIFCVPALSLATAVISFAMSFVLNKIPFINKWLV